MITATYPGTFDPLTNGHLDLIRRACWIFPKLIVAVAESKRKHTLFTLEERVQMAKEAVKGFPNVEVVGFEGLLVDFVRRHGSTCIVRGARAVSDFEYEFQMAGMNQKLMPEVETIFLTPAEQFQFISGTFVREIAMMGGDVSGFVPQNILAALERIIFEPRNQVPVQMRYHRSELRPIDLLGTDRLDNGLLQARQSIPHNQPGLEIQIGNFLYVILPNQPEVARKLRILDANNAKFIVCDNDVLLLRSTKGAVLRHNNTFSIPPSFSLFTVS